MNVRNCSQETEGKGPLDKGSNTGSASTWPQGRALQVLDPLTWRVRVLTAPVAINRE